MRIEGGRSEVPPKAGRRIDCQASREITRVIGLEGVHYTAYRVRMV